MKEIGKKIIFAIVGLVVLFLLYYFTLPAINIHSQGFWVVLILVIVLGFGGYVISKIKKKEDIRTGKGTKGFAIVLGAVLLVFIVGMILSSPLVNAKKYQQLLTVETRAFTDDIQQVSYNQIPILDKESSKLLANRKMGSLVEMVSQFEVSDDYSQINYLGKPVRVTPLTYASPIKWFTNQKEGIPAYIQVDMTNQNTECIMLENPIRYSKGEFFNRNIYRHLRFRYPTYIFSDLFFEIDEEGTPYWICPVKKFNVGLFGGQTIGKVVLCNASTGETSLYDVADVPTWVDKVYTAELLIQLYDYYGSLKHGFFNSIIGQKDCLQTSDGYNYIALEDDVWVYTGITSITSDRSIVGFVLMNQRTMETRYYSCMGAEEYSAMSSAEGQVQNLGYIATFPLLLNIAEEPTYFIALKDNAGLVKKYAMVNIGQYQIVAIGDSVAECEKQYITLLKTNGVESGEAAATMKITNKRIQKIAQGVIDGNTHYYLMLEGDNDIYDVTFLENLGILRYDVGDVISFEYIEGEESNTVLSIQ